MNTATLAVDERISMEHSAETERIWQEMHDRLLSYINRRVEPVQDAEDILQDVFLRIHASLSNLNDTQSVTAWVYQIARNAITDYYRKRASAGKAMAGLTVDALASTNYLAEDDPTAEAEFTRCLEPLLNELPAPYRQALVLTELNGVTQKNAAGQLGLSVSGMKARVQRGRSKLKDVIDDCCSVELDRRGGLVDYHRRDGSTCEGCSCD